MTRARDTIAIAVSTAALALGACGGGDEPSDTGAGGADGQGAAAPAPDTAFDALSTALEGEGLAVSQLPPSSLQGAEAGVSISGDKQGTAQLFATQQRAEDYAKQAEKGGAATATVGTAVFESRSQQDADSFADAYEG